MKSFGPSYPLSTDQLYDSSTSLRKEDENINRFKEVEELYSEVLKAAELDMPAEGFKYCTAAYFGPCKSEIQLNPTENNLDTPRKVFMRAKIVMTPERNRVSTAMFRRNRKKAMTRTKSSKSSYKYNFGGFIPASETDVVALDDYEKFLRRQPCDFLTAILFENKVPSPALVLKEDSDDKVKEVKQRALSDTDEGNWSPEVLDALDPEITVHKRPYSGMELQKQLDIIFAGLGIDKEQQIEMSIKYGQIDRINIEACLRMWREVVTLIQARESLLHEIEKFEDVSSNPKRFFGRGNRASSEKRIQEEIGRDSLLTNLAATTEQISRLIKNIYRGTSEIVTYHGQSYSQKMENDLNETMKRVHASFK